MDKDYKLCIICCLPFVLNGQRQEEEKIGVFLEQFKTHFDKNIDCHEEFLKLETSFGISVCYNCCTEITELLTSKETMKNMEDHLVSLQMEILKGLRELEKCMEKIKCHRINLKKSVEESDELILKNRLNKENRITDCFTFKLREWIIKDGNEKLRTEANGPVQPIVKLESPANCDDDQNHDNDETSNLSLNWNDGEVPASEIKNEGNFSRDCKKSSSTLITRTSTKIKKPKVKIPKKESIIPKRQSTKKKKKLQKTPIPKKPTVRKKKRPHFQTRRYCDLCPFNTREEPSYEQHMRQHENETDPQSKSLECPDCPLKFSTQQLFAFHQKCHQNLYKMCCDICLKPTPIFLLAQHLKSHFPPGDQEPSPKIIYCENCSFCCSSRKTYISHLRRHCSNKIKAKYSCDLCSEQFTRPILLLNHFHEKHEGTLEKWKCDFPNCEKTYNSKGSLINHKLVHNPNIRLQCPNCDKTFFCKSHLEIHSQIHTDVKPYSCGLCDKRFRWKTMVISHQRMEHGVAKLKCNFCEKEFCVDKALRAHIAKIHENKGLPCEICGKIFTGKHNFKRHVESHGEENRFTCDVCGKGFKMEKGLKVHKQVHGGVKNWKCEYCEKSFMRGQNLRDHLRVHTGERPFVCDICGKDFNQQSALKTHKKKQHSIKSE